MMPSEKADDKMNRQTDLALLESVWKRIWDQLENEKYRIFSEIRHYPLPIPACDVQFNTLLEERAKISQELGRVAAIPKQRLMPGDYIRWIDEFIESSSYINGEVEQSIRSALSKLNGSEGGVADAGR